jgi:hypothetical protein
MKSLLISIFLMLFCVGCGPDIPEHTCKYTIWSGTAVFAAGYGAEAYRQTEVGDISFTNCLSGKRLLIPKTSLWKIEENY